MLVVVLLAKVFIVSGVEQSLRSGEMGKNDLILGMFPVRVGFIMFFERLDAEAIYQYFETSNDISDRRFVINMIGWKQRSDLVSLLEDIISTNRLGWRSAYVSWLSIKEEIVFKGDNLAEEYYRGYFLKIIHRMEANNEDIFKASAMVLEERLRTKQD